jgi:toxin-antitoxin system PIN domain toxin
LSGRYILADVNLWLATLVEEHDHHSLAVDWWRDEALSSGARVAFCRITQLGLLRLVTNETVMGKKKRSIDQAWQDYEQLLSQEPIIYVDEPEGVESLMKDLCAMVESSRNFWTDAYLSAFAIAIGFSFATFDKGFRRFPGLELTLLS